MTWISSMNNAAILTSASTNFRSLADSIVTEAGKALDSVRPEPLEKNDSYCPEFVKYVMRYKAPNCLWWTSLMRGRS